MARTYNYGPEIAIAADLRKRLPRQRSLLFHGTRSPCAILRSDCILYHRDLVEGGVSFSRLLHVAIYWARLFRPTGEGQGGIFVLDREKLARDFRLLPYCWRGWGSDKSRGDFEAEELIVGLDVNPLRRYLLDVLWLPESCNRPLLNKPSAVDLKAVCDLVIKPTKSRRTTQQQILQKLRRVDYLVSQGELRARAIHEVGATEVAYRRWKRKYGRAGNAYEGAKVSLSPPLIMPMAKAA